MIFTGAAIRRAYMLGELTISPWTDSQLNSNSYNLRLGKTIMVYNCAGPLDMALENGTITDEIAPEGLVLHPGTIYLGHTEESIHSDRYVPILDGRSSIGRLGLCVHSTAGYGDLGFRGTFTLELSVVQPVRIYAGVEICQIRFQTILGTDQEMATNTAAIKYEGKYNGQTGPRPSGIWKEKHKWEAWNE